MVIVLEIIKGKATVIGRMTFLGMVTILGMVVLRMVNVLMMARAAIWTLLFKELYLIFISKIRDRQTNNRQTDSTVYKVSLQRKNKHT